MSRPECTVVARAAGADMEHPIALSVIVPAFNEADRVPAVLQSLQRHTTALSSVEVIVVDDGSTDATVTVATEHLSWCEHRTVIEHRTNQGKGAAVRTGVAAARGRLVAFVDADDATDLRSLDALCAGITGNVAAVFGSRHAPGASVAGSPPIRGLMGRVFNHLVRVAAGTSISDTQCGAKVFWRPAARAVFSATSIDGFAFDVELLRRLLDLGVDVIEHPVDWRYMPGTKITLLTPARMIADIIRLRFRAATFAPPSFDVVWRPALHSIAEPLTPGAVPTDGQVVRMLVPDGSPSLDELATRLQVLGVEVV